MTRSERPEEAGARVFRLSTRCPICNGKAQAGLMFGRVIACGFCQGFGIVFAGEGLVASERKQAARWAREYPPDGRKRPEFQKQTHGQYLARGLKSENEKAQE